MVLLVFGQYFQGWRLLGIQMSYYSTFWEKKNKLSKDAGSSANRYYSFCITLQFGTTCNVRVIQFTGRFDWKLSNVDGCRTESVHFRLYVGKAKMLLRGGKHTAKNCKQISKNEENFHLSNAFWLYPHRVKSASIRFYTNLLLTIFNWHTLYLQNVPLLKTKVQILETNTNIVTDMEYR